MGIQELFLAAVFVLALLYIGRMMYRSLSSNKGCASNCGKCGVDFSKVKIPEQKR